LERWLGVVAPSANCGDFVQCAGSLHAPRVARTAGSNLRWHWRATANALGRCPGWVCAVTRRRFPVGASPTRQPLQPEATGAAMEVTKWLKPSDSVSRIGDSASVQAATRVNAEQTSKRTMCRPTRQPYRGRLIRLGLDERRIHPAAAPGQWRQHVHKESARNTGSPKAWSGMTNRTPARDRPGAVG
jgi:hypothetical protein